MSDVEIEAVIDSVIGDVPGTAYDAAPDTVNHPVYKGGDAQ